LIVDRCRSGAIESAATQEPAHAEPSPEPPRLALEEYVPEASALAEVASPAAKPLAATPTAGMRSARVAAIAGRTVSIFLRGLTEPVDAEIAPEVEPALIGDAHANGDMVLVEFCEGEAPLVIGVLATRRPRELHLKATTITIEGEREVRIRTGRGALRIREDGDIEVVGSRISASSRGLFRIVGRILRLN